MSMIPMVTTALFPTTGWDGVAWPIPFPVLEVEMERGHGGRLDALAATPPTISKAESPDSPMAAA